MPPQGAEVALCAAKGLCPADGVQLVAFLLQALPAKAGILQESKTGPRQGQFKHPVHQRGIAPSCPLQGFSLAARHSASSLSQVYPLFPTSGMGFCSICQNFAQLIDGMHKFFIMKLLLYSMKSTSLILLHCRTKFCGKRLISAHISFLYRGAKQKIFAPSMFVFQGASYLYPLNCPDL